MGSLEADEVYAILKKKIDSGGGGTSDYSGLNNLPQVNGVELKGNKTTKDLKINDVFFTGETTTFGELKAAVSDGKLCVYKFSQMYLYLIGVVENSDTGKIEAVWSGFKIVSEDSFTSEPYYVMTAGSAEDAIGVINESSGSTEIPFNSVSKYIKVFSEQNTIRDIFNNDSIPLRYVLARNEDNTDNIYAAITKVYSDPYGNHVTLQWLDGEKIKYMQMDGVASTSTIAEAMSESDWNLLSTPIPEISTSSLNVTIYPNAFYKWVDTTVSALTLQLGEGEDGQVNEYHFAFKSGETATNLSLPASVQTDIIVEPNMYYECSILNNMMVFREWPLEAK